MIDCEPLYEEFGKDCLTGTDVQVTVKYGGSKVFNIPFRESAAVQHVIEQARFAAPEKSQVSKYKDTQSLYNYLKNIKRSEKQEQLFKKLETYRNQRATLRAIDLVDERFPYFLYSSH